MRGRTRRTQVRERARAAGLQYLQRAMDDERSERTRSVPSVASRRVAAPYGVDDLALERSISSKKVLKFKARYARQGAAPRSS